MAGLGPFHIELRVHTTFIPGVDWALLVQTVIAAICLFHQTPRLNPLPLILNLRLHYIIVFQSFKLIQCFISYFNQVKSELLQGVLVRYRGDQVHDAREGREEDREVCEEEGLLVAVYQV